MLKNLFCSSALPDRVKTSFSFADFLIKIGIIGGLLTLMCNPQLIIKIPLIPLNYLITAVISALFYNLSLICSIVAFTINSGFRALALSYASTGVVIFASKFAEIGLSWSLVVGTFLTIYSAVAIRLLCKEKKCMSMELDSLSVSDVANNLKTSFSKRIWNKNILTKNISGSITELSVDRLQNECWDKESRSGFAEELTIYKEKFKFTDATLGRIMENIKNKLSVEKKEELKITIKSPILDA